MSRFFCSRVPAGGLSGSKASEFPAPAVDIPAPAASETVVLTGGCFWGVEAVWERLEGVSDAVSGFAGGYKATAH